MELELIKALMPDVANLLSKSYKCTPKEQQQFREVGDIFMVESSTKIHLNVNMFVGKGFSEQTDHNLSQ